MPAGEIIYSERYEDEEFEYRHVLPFFPFFTNKNWLNVEPFLSIFSQMRKEICVLRHVTLPAELAKLVPRNHLMTETEWRNLGHYLLLL